MADVLAHVQGVLMGGALRITKPRGLNPGIVYVVASILAKGCKTFPAIRGAALEGCGQDASILLRALFESTIALHYILQRDSNKRAILYAAHQDQRRLVLIEQTRRTPGVKRFFTKAELARAKAKVAQWGQLVGQAETESVRKHWAGPGGLEAATRMLGPRSGWPRVYSLMYRKLSSFSHGSDLDDHMFTIKGADTPVVKVLPGSDELERVLPMSCTLLLAMCSRFDYRLGLGIADRTEQLKKRAVALAKALATQGHERST